MKHYVRYVVDGCLFPIELDGSVIFNLPERTLPPDATLVGEFRFKKGVSGIELLNMKENWNK